MAILLLLIFAGYAAGLLLPLCIPVQAEECKTSSLTDLPVLPAAGESPLASLGFWHPNHLRWPYPRLFRF